MKVLQLVIVSVSDTMGTPKENWLLKLRGYACVQESLSPSSKHDRRSNTVPPKSPVLVCENNAFSKTEVHSASTATLVGEEDWPLEAGICKGKEVAVKNMGVDRNGDQVASESGEATGEVPVGDGVEQEDDEEEGKTWPDGSQADDELEVEEEPDGAQDAVDDETPDPVSPSGTIRYRKAFQPGAADEPADYYWVRVLQISPSLPLLLMNCCWLAHFFAFILPQRGSNHVSSLVDCCNRLLETCYELLPVIHASIFVVFLLSLSLCLHMYPSVCLSLYTGLSISFSFSPLPLCCSIGLSF